MEKREWLREHLPEIDLDHQIMLEIGRSKAAYVRDLSENDVLFDDYNVSLEQWERKGGIAVKCKNNVNHHGLNGVLWTKSLIDNSKTPKEIAQSLKKALPCQAQIKTIRLYSPIFPNMYFTNDYGDIGNEPTEIPSYEAVEHIDALNKLMVEQYGGFGEKGLMEYYHGMESVKEKTVSIKQHFEVIEDDLLCVTEVDLKADLTADEINAVKEYVIGQNADGAGEIFEQQFIRTEDGELYTSLWSSDDDFFIKTEQEYLSYQEQSENLTIAPPSL